MNRRIPVSAAVVAALAGTLAVTGCGSSGHPAPSHSPARAPAAVRGFDEAGVSTGTGDNFTPADWKTIRADGFTVFITDPIRWSSECAGNGCSRAVTSCTIDPSAVAQLQDAESAGLDIAVYTRNVNCLPAAISGLPPALRAHLSFAVLDIEPGPGIPLTSHLIEQVTALGQTPVVYSYSAGWQAVMGASTAFSSHPLMDAQAPGSGQPYPAPYPAGYPVLRPMPAPYGGWSGIPPIEQQQTNAAIQGSAGTIGGPANAVDLDSVSASWLASLPHHS
jgi:hypothetical protein